MMSKCSGDVFRVVWALFWNDLGCVDAGHDFRMILLGGAATLVRQFMLNMLIRFMRISGRPQRRLQNSTTVHSLTFCMICVYGTIIDVFFYVE